MRFFRAPTKPKGKAKPARMDPAKLPISGPLVAGRKFRFDDDFGFDVDRMAQHEPKQQLSPLSSDTYRVMGKTALTAMTKRKMVPTIFSNPMQHLDYRIFESLMKHTFIGALMDAFVKYVVGQGFEPEIEVINPDDDDEKNAALIAKHQDKIEWLKKIDMAMDLGPGLDATFKEKMAALIMSALGYNRGALIKYYSPDGLHINGQKQNEQIPSGVIFAHAQDLGMIEVDEETRRLKRVQWRQAYEGWVETDDMIYLWNPVTSSKIYNSWHYGISMLAPLISASKMIRQLLNDDFPAMATEAWASLFYLIVKNEGNTRESKKKEYEEITSNSKPGVPNILIKDPEDVRLDAINYDPKIAEFKDLLETLIKLSISIMGLPQVGFFDESAANRATMVGKIQLTMRTTIEPIREWIGRAICQQWYLPNILAQYGSMGDDNVRIKLSFKDLHISEWYDNLEAALALDGKHKLKHEAFGEVAGIDNYQAMLDPDAEDNPGGQNSGMDWPDGKGGKIGMNKKKMGPQSGDGQGKMGPKDKDK